MKKWELGALNIYDYSKPGPLDIYFNFIKKNFKDLKGNIFEFGVFRGKSLLATALLLKKLGSKKKVIGFDSFSGFPSYHSNDDINQFKILFETNKISKKHYQDVIRNINIRSLFLKEESKLNTKNISNSGDFSDCNFEVLQKKINFLHLDNIVLIKGNFANTLVNIKDNGEAMCCLIDCDLYESYKYSLPKAWENTTKGGMIYLDEYYSLKFPGAKIAVDEFIKNKDINIKMQSTNFDPDFLRSYIIK
tara:strand:- start:294 stop:1037 length:744 start_codon:yes stop_codon:yes gene_type:complete